MPSNRPPALDVSRRALLAAAAGAVAVPGTALAQGKPDAAALQAKTDILIGQSAPLTGPLAPLLKAWLAGGQVAIDEVNRRGGIN
ncbi:hypothetical protein GCM10027034_36900 [Ramlibacter solisilvae]